MHRTNLYWGTLSTLSVAIFTITSAAIAEEVVSTTNQSAPQIQSGTVKQPQQLKTIVVTGSTALPKDPDISAVAKTVVTRQEMLKYGDQSVNDALRRAAGFQMPTPGQGPRGGSGSMRFRGGGAPVFLINGEPVQGGPRGGMSVIDSITPEMIDRIEITKQPSVTQGSVASSAVINIILKVPLDDARMSGNVKLGYGLTKSDKKEEERKNLAVQADGRDGPWIYSVSANQMWNDSTSTTEVENANGTRQQTRNTDRTSTMFAPRVEYQLDDHQKLVAEIFYRNNETDGSSGSQIQNDKNDSIRLNTRYERKDKGDSDKVRFTVEKQNETESTQSSKYSSKVDETVTEFGFAYDGVRKFDETKQIKFGFDSHFNELESNIAETLDEQRYALYLEGSWKFTPRQTITLGARQEWLDRSGLVEYTDQNISPVLAHRFDFTDVWSLQTNISRAIKSPSTNNLMPTVSISTDADSGTMNNPDQGGNPNLLPEKITALETTLGYNTSAGGVNITAYHRDIDNYIEKVIRLENGRYVERPYNQDQATTYGVEVSGRYALKQTSSGHSLMVTGQVSTVRAEIEDIDHNKRLASDVAPYTASTGLSYNYQPWKLSTSVNVTYTPEFTRALDYLPYDRTSNDRVNVDISATKRFDKGWAATLSARNILSTDYKERLNNQSDGSLYEARINDAIPSFLFTVEKKF